MSNEARTVTAACQANLGLGLQMEMELSSRGILWALAGANVTEANLWMKEAAEGLDLRVRISRGIQGLVVAVDRGDNDGTWWHGNSAPRLIIDLDSNQAKVSAAIGAASASPHESREVRSIEVDLGSVSLGT